MAPFEALYGRKCRSSICGEEMGKRKIYGPELIQQTTQTIEIIKKRLIAAQDRQRKYADLGRRHKEFEVGDKKVGTVSYQLALPPDLQNIHDMFHITFLKAYHPDNRHVLAYEPIEVQSDLTYEEQLVRIVDGKVQRLRNKEISLVKVIWRNQSIEEITWGSEEDMRKNFPSLFSV
ncbi:uncharacterized protein LOC141680016 [Apium graveolens]|uniref:uncharacterized protein LOC141680016 n=1 Tax=Apium graveolens TaxID=4045 RepID=UPI003D79F82C